MLVRPSSVALVVVAIVTASGCASMREAGVRAYDAAEAFDAATGRATTPREAAEALSKFRHVYVGERHGDVAFHGVQLAVLQALYERGVPLAIGVEWLPHTAQPTLDRYLSGALDEAPFARAVQLEQRWGEAAKHQRRIFRWARARGVPVYGLNAAPGLARRVAEAGVDQLPADVREKLPPLDSGNAAHRAFFDAMMRAAAAHHGKGDDGEGGAHGELTEETLARYYQAQLVWDETMALQVAARMAEHPERTIVVLAGLGHIEHGHGIPARAAKASGDGAFAIVRPLPPGEEPRPEPEPYPARRADWFWRVPGFE